ncbi:hypothetical protein EVAR_14455_1 [Eumeta japonica]|uniref:Uncharacterized protein n=1 Tax=Eumeta variegata TaxID=151549 RepID=A0A4C1U389_EUMVA|nr:hypothetical protein EVAR_14455_1 [Eumeta japonica]
MVSVNVSSQKQQFRFERGIHIQVELLSCHVCKSGIADNCYHQHECNRFNLPAVKKSWILPRQGFGSGASQRDGGAPTAPRPPLRRRVRHHTIRISFAPRSKLTAARL